jgi:hypothetical protein
VGGQAVGASTLIGLESDNQTSTLESSQYLVERARGQVYACELLDVLHEGVAVLVASREAGKYENRGASVSPEAH